MYFTPVIEEFLPSFLIDAEWSAEEYAALGNTLSPPKLQDAPSFTLRQPPSSYAALSTRHTPADATHQHPPSRASVISLDDHERETAFRSRLTEPHGAVANTTYVLTITDPDAPSRDDPKWSEFCHWIATSVPVSDDSEVPGSVPRLSLRLKDFEDVMPYYPPGPPEKTGKHRYVFIVFAPANGTSDSLNLTKPGDRKHWGYEYEGARVGVRKWSSDNGLVPVGMS